MAEGTEAASALPYYENVQIGVDAEGRPIVRICTITGAMSHECASCGAFVPVRPEDHRHDRLWVAAVEWVKRDG
jgi:hypothetical protein